MEYFDESHDQEQECIKGEEERVNDEQIEQAEGEHGMYAPEF